MASDQNKSATDIEREQEAMLAKKYGGMLKRKQPLMPKEHKYFDSADFFLAREGKGDQPAAEEALLPRTSPAVPAAHHGASKLEGGAGKQTAP